MGEWDLQLMANEKPFPPQDFEVEDIVIHEYYDAELLTDNFALLYIYPNVNLGQFPNIKTICLPDIDLTLNDPAVMDLINGGQLRCMVRGEKI